MKPLSPDLRAAYAECQRLARHHYENFPVASLLVPRDRRDALAAIYAFARSADDFADEPGVKGRLELLADWRRRLYECAEGEPKHPVFLALGDAIRRYNLSLENLDNLLRAFESDVRENRHQDFASLLSYSKFSANPVGRLVLELFDHRDPELLGFSDNICTALQLTNFWQDVRIDLERDRIYLPLEDLARFNISLEDIQRWGCESRGNRAGAGPDHRWRALMALEAERTWELFVNGKPLPERVVPQLRSQLRLTWLTGTAILARIESANYDVFNRRPKLRWFDFLRLYAKARHPLTSETAQRGSGVAAGQQGRP
ncbi:MAG TPA: squalene synthase HpnC [Terriglobia bacterium]|nr:squalene synthase HpnC [Terriglobia bacterium]